MWGQGLWHLLGSVQAENGIRNKVRSKFDSYWKSCIFEPFTAILFDSKFKQMSALQTNIFGIVSIMDTGNRITVKSYGQQSADLENECTLQMDQSMRAIRTRYCSKMHIIYDGGVSKYPWLLHLTATSLLLLATRSRQRRHTTKN